MNKELLKLIKDSILKKGDEKKHLEEMSKKEGVNLYSPNDIIFYNGTVITRSGLNLSFGNGIFNVYTEFNKDTEDLKVIEYSERHGRDEMALEWFNKIIN